MLKQKVWADIFAPEGELLKAGQTLRRENYARTLQKIGREGASAFYHVSSSTHLTFISQFVHCFFFFWCHLFELIDCFYDFGPNRVRWPNRWSRLYDQQEVF